MPVFWQMLHLFIVIALNAVRIIELHRISCIPVMFMLPFCM